MTRRRIHVLTLLAAVLALVTIGPTAQADVTPTLLVSDHVLLRGDSAQMWGRGFAPDVSYTVSVDYGTLDGAGGSVPVTTTADGEFTASYTMTFDVPANVETITITVTDEQGSTAL